jgi:uncharacterized protein YuzE
MKIEYDKTADALYIRLNDRPRATTREVDDNVIVDIGADGKIVGIELLFVSDYLDPADVESFTVSHFASA